MPHDKRRGDPVSPGVAGRFAARHLALCSPREGPNVVFRPCPAYPFARCMMRQGNILFYLQALFTAFAPPDPACVTMTSPGNISALAVRISGNDETKNLHEEVAAMVPLYADNTVSQAIHEVSVGWAGFRRPPLAAWS